MEEKNECKNIKKMLVKSKGITLIALSVTIVVMIILATIIVKTVFSDGGIIFNSHKTKFFAQVEDLHSQVDRKSLLKEDKISGTINDVLGTDSKYNDILYIQEGELVYDPDETSDKEEAWLQELGIEPMGDYFTVEFETSGGTKIESQNIRSGKNVKKPVDPIKKDCDFVGWYYYTDEKNSNNLTYDEKKFDFSQPISQNYILYAKYEGEAIMVPAKYESQELYWQYKEQITSVVFTKSSGQISIPSTAVEKWEHVEDNSKCSQVAAYLEDDGTGGYKLTITSTKKIYAHPYATYYFYKFTNLKKIDFTNFNTSKCISLDSFFRECQNLEEIKKMNFNTSHVKYFGNMFNNCKKLSAIDVANFNTSNAKYMNYMFWFCQSLQSLNVSNFKTDQVVDMQGMFGNLTNITSINVSKFNTQNVTNMKYMFAMDKALTSLDLSNLNTENVTDMSYMFQGVAKIKSLDLSSFKTKKVENMTYMFYQATALSDLNISTFSFKSATNISRMFSYCTNLNTEINFDADENNSINYEKIFNSTATASDSGVIVNYTDSAAGIIDEVINTKSTTSNVEIGELIN